LLGSERFGIEATALTEGMPKFKNSGSVKKDLEKI